MLGRTANDLFWLSRYIERAENMARLVEVGCRIALIPREGESTNNEWRSTLESAGCCQAYFDKYGTLSATDAIRFLLFDLDNPSSVHTCLTTARRNGRAQRTALTREMWESLNTSWMEFQAIKPETIGSDRLLDLLDWIRARSAGYRGALLNTILRNDTYHFSQLGTFLERADNTARILDVKYYVLLPSSDMVGSGVDNAQWHSILRSVSAHRSYRWAYKGGYRSWRIADYLILNRAMPRSLRACYGEIDTSLNDLTALYKEVKPCRATAKSTLTLLEQGDIDVLFQSGLHEFLLDFIARNNRLGQEISDAYHFDA